MHIQKYIQKYWHLYKTEILAVACAVLLGVLSLAVHGPLQGYLPVDLEYRKQVRSSAVQTPAIRNGAVGSTRTQQTRAAKRLQRKLARVRKPSRRGASSAAVSSIRPARRSADPKTSTAAKPAAAPAPTAASTSAPVTTLREGPPVAEVTPSAVVRETAGFPAFNKTVYPVSRVPNWGSMTRPDGPKGWNRTYAEMEDSDFVPLPAYDLEKLVVPMDTLLNPRNALEITRKLTYSTRYFSAYDIDRGEWTGLHSGIDLKLPIGTPIAAIAGGRVQTAADSSTLGLHVIIEHRHPTDGTFYSIYAHFESLSVQAGQDVEPGQIIGRVGMTGHTSGPHLHFAVDRSTGAAKHSPYAPTSTPSREEAARRSENPIRFIQRYAGGVQ